MREERARGFLGRLSQGEAKQPGASDVRRPCEGYA